MYVRHSRRYLGLRHHSGTEAVHATAHAHDGVFHTVCKVVTEVMFVIVVIIVLKAVLVCLVW